eukprot:7824512-Pyramimonas_sp.AAC.1
MFTIPSSPPRWSAGCLLSMSSCCAPAWAEKNARAPQRRSCHRPSSAQTSARGWQPISDSAYQGAPWAPRPDATAAASWQGPSSARPWARCPERSRTALGCRPPPSRLRHPRGGRPRSSCPRCRRRWPPRCHTCGRCHRCRRPQPWRCPSPLLWPCPW